MMNFFPKIWLHIYLFETMMEWVKRIDCRLWLSRGQNVNIKFLRYATFVYCTILTRYFWICLAFQ